MTNGISKKGRQGFAHRYQSLGETKLIRVPVSIKDNIIIIMKLVADLSTDKGPDKANKILENIIAALESMHE
jgi:hypothetical protein